MKRKLAGVFLVVIALLAGAAALHTWSFLYPKGHDSNRFVVLDVSPGKSFREVSEELVREGVLVGSKEFRILVRLLGKSQALKVGEYRLEHRQPPLEVLAAITSGKSIARQFTVPEGYNMYEIAALLESQGLGRQDEILKLFKNSEWASSLVGEKVETIEGYLFPETYAYTKYTSLETILKNMVDLFHQNYAQISSGQEAPLSRHQMVTLASIVEKETGLPGERRRIAGVFYNRLKKKMRLQTDPTIVYGVLDETGKAPERILTRHLRTPTRYNTYTISGLPPGPIASPGRAALEATFHPEPSDYLYFVSRNDGSHFFSKTYKEHHQAVLEYQIRTRSR